MLRHIVMWNFKAGLSEEENQKNALKIKADLEALAAQIPGVESLEVYIEALPSSNRSIVLDSLFTDESALAGYQQHPEHVKAGGFIGEVTQDRTCIDFII